MSTSAKRHNLFYNKIYFKYVNTIIVYSCKFEEMKL